MIQINEVNIISIDKTEDVWAIEGEILFEGDFSTFFSVSYAVEYDELDELELEIIPGAYDAGLLGKMITEAAVAYDE